MRVDRFVIGASIDDIADDLKKSFAEHKTI